MFLVNWIEKRIQRMNWLDIGILKICVFAFALILVTLIPELLRVGWKIWAVIFAISYIYLAAKFLRPHD